MNLQSKKVNTPALNVLGKTKAQEFIDDGLKSLEENWTNREADKEDPGCVLVYGVDKGETFAYVMQKDIHDYYEYAALLRENEAKLGKKDLPFGKIKWVMPKAIKLEMMSRGYPVDEILMSGDTYEIDVFIEQHFPQLKTTNLILSKQKVPVIH